MDEGPSFEDSFNSVVDANLKSRAINQTFVETNQQSTFATLSDQLPSDLRNN